MGRLFIQKIGASTIVATHHRIHPDTVRTFLAYVPETGLFHWLQNRPRARAGMLAGTVNDDGYVSIVIRGTPCLGHNLAWLLTHGHWPPSPLAHVNGLPADNRIANLRLADAPMLRDRLDGGDGTSAATPPPR